MKKKVIIGLIVLALVIVAIAIPKSHTNVGLAKRMKIIILNNLQIIKESSLLMKRIN